MSNLHRERLVEAGAIVRGHFVLTSGEHSEFYVNKTAALVLASHMEFHATAIAGRYAGHRIEVVVGPELGAIALGAVVAQKLKRMTKVDVAFVMATKARGLAKLDEKDPALFEIGRDQARFVKNKRALIVEDILTKGDSAAETVRAVRRVGGFPIAVGALWNRGGISAAAIGVPDLFSAIDEQIPSFSAEECPLCKSELAVDTLLGHGAAFVAQQEAKQK